VRGKGSPIHTNPWTQFLINIVSCSVTVTVICTGIHGEEDKLPMSFSLSEGNKFHKKKLKVRGKSE
jgi:hypothetical protein